MALDIADIKKNVDKGFTANQTTRERAADDLVFYWVTQWDDQFLSSSNLAYRGEFNMVRKAGNQIIADLQANPVHPNFEPVDETRDDAAEIMDGLWRKDSHHVSSIEAFANAQSEQVVCGIAAWKIVNEYESSRNGSTNQVLRRYPIYEANNRVIWDPNSKLVDKSDAKWVCELEPYSVDGYKDLVEELTGERPESINASNFKEPEQSYTFPWFNGQDLVYVGNYYTRKKVKRKVYITEDMFGNVMTLDAEKVDPVIDAMQAAGQQIVDEKEIERWEVTRVVCSGEDILDESVVPGEHLPIIPLYGYRAFIEGEEHWEGVTNLAKDPQRLRNFQLSYLADIVSRSPRNKGIFFPEQIAGFEYMYEESGADNNYPYLLQNKTDANGNDLPIGPVGEMPEQRMPQALAAMTELTRQAIEDVANPGIPQDIADPDLSGKAVLALQNRLDQQSMEYQFKFKMAIRRDAQVYASMAADVYDVPRKVMVELPDGTKKEVMTMQMVLDDNMEPIIINDLSNAEFDVYAEIGPAYSTMKQQTRDELIQLMGMMSEGDPTRQALMMKYLRLLDGEDMVDIREYANKQLLLSGIKEPETQEEFEMVQQAQQAAQQQEDPNMEFARAETLKGQADVMSAQTDQMEAQIKAFEAETKRQKVQIDAAEAGVEIQKKQMETAGINIDNAMKLRGSAQQARQ